MKLKLESALGWAIAGVIVLGTVLEIWLEGDTIDVEFITESGEDGHETSEEPSVVERPARRRGNAKSVGKVSRL